MPYERMSDIRQKIAWSNHHIENVNAAIRTFMGTEPYALRVDVETDPMDPCVRVLKADPVPFPVRLGCGDAVQTLRTALDYLACALVRANGGKVSKQTAFPILSGPIVTKELVADFDRKVAGMRQEAKDQIKAVKPYRGGDDTLWRLHELNRFDKHQMLIIALGNITALNGLPPIGQRWDGNVWGGIPGVPPSLKEGDTFTPRTPGVKVDRDTAFFAEVVFNQSGVAEGYPVTLGLREFYRRVKILCGELSWALK